MFLEDDTSVIIENCKNKIDRKCLRKQRRAHHRLFRDMKIKCMNEPTQHLMICNGGFITGMKREMLQSILNMLISKYTLIMPSDKSYCFITCNMKEDAICVYNYIHGRIKLPNQNGPLYVCYTETVPNMCDNTLESMFPPGLTLIENFITEEQEKSLLATLDWNECESTSLQLKHRQVKHFGYEFEYDTNTVDSDRPIVPIPQDYKFLQDLFHKYGHKYTYDQLTINKYLPGQGIPPHVDTHSVFEDTILSLSLGSSCVMSFKRANRKIDIYLSNRSLLIMTGEARYAWTHGICPRHSDVVNMEDGGTIQERGTRVSFTFRKVRRADNCHCSYKEQCDARCNNVTTIDNKTAMGLEHSHVHKIYEEISGHFSETRHKQWPNVAKFLDSLERGTILLDVGCGNGKYLYRDQNVYKLGCDRSSGLTNICCMRGFEILLCDCQHLPYRDESVDAVINIAVIHHLATRERRKRAIAEMMRVLRPNGRCLIYVWAKEQRKNSSESFYVKFGPGSYKEKSHETSYEIDRGYRCLTLPIHESRTNFAHSDLLVPWTKKDGRRFLRYYHVFQEGELEQLCTEVPVTVLERVYYDQGNWCVILKKCTEKTK